MLLFKQLVAAPFVGALGVNLINQEITMFTLRFYKECPPSGESLQSHKEQFAISCHSYEVESYTERSAPHHLVKVHPSNKNGLNGLFTIASDLTDDCYDVMYVENMAGKTIDKIKS